ncbi:Pkinase-domain-containing protein [Gloeophyllum trabeum ATCC 11539]|uniref:non-specific serine/threonine protein kinase n=1 Tax=Gloeophyllum trabeum (strain ATCC 11539 / FP-39264 / Madison 617) TaxID=670483 RepID=S7PWG6_GLOTA|nr:Pkinase-domain-containing protein [Gloeophyllum trabeum ATCC 11539]EPQ51677.1 Pkinase-domain-containing protein [Gloeophyllum trabeum ATCC 11539]
MFINPGFELIEQIGGGGFSRVFRAVNAADHRVAACKLVLTTKETTETSRKMLDKEMRIHAALKHSNVLEFFNAIIVEITSKQVYVPGTYMLLEFAAGGDLFDKIVPDMGIGEDVAHVYFTQLVSGMEYIHSQGVCHRDLKPENLLLDAAGALKITDFGLSSVYKLKETGKTRLLTERCGSLPYVAPEVILCLNSESPYQAEPIDIWGMGVILFTLLAGNTPWDEPTKKSPEFRRYLSGDILKEAPWNRLDQDVLSLIVGLLNIDPSRRMTIPDIIQHPWYQRASFIAAQGVGVLAEHLTQPLRTVGDFDIAAPEVPMYTDADGDQVMQSAHQTQFTQSLLLFSQTQNGRRYTPHLTRFYCSIPPHDLMPLIQQSLEDLGITFKLKPQDQSPSAPDVIRLRIGGYDRRKEMFKGWVDVERYAYNNVECSFCIMQRDQGNPISWRQLWKALVMSPKVDPHVLRKR